MSRPGLRRPYTVRRVTADGAAGRTRTLSRGTDEIARDIFQDAGGGLYAGWLARSAPRAQVLVRGSRDGREWSDRLRLARVPYETSSLDLGASRRGRGVAVYQSGSAQSGRQGAIYAVRFRGVR
jgi:hypothetical protein